MAELSYVDLVEAFAQLELKDAPVIAHASLHAFGRVNGGAETVVQALTETVGALVMPTHTYAPMITPKVGPANNGMIYGSGQDLNRMAEFFTPSLPADRLMGVIPETLRQRPEAKRSMHPLLSFAGIRAGKILAAQTMDEPLAPLRLLAEWNGWVLLLGVDHTVNTTIHYGERLAGRRQFTRWALTEQGIIECPNFPGCSAGFRVIEKDMQPHTRKLQVGEALAQAVPINELLKVIVTRLKNNPKDLLCADLSCARCNEVRKL
jgi:aminoglycoside 3-N-acetyltransferase